MKREIFSIIRFIAALIVIFFHTKSKFPFLEGLPRILISGPQMCTLFFVLSGFFLSSTKDHGTTSNFVISRLAKIYPIYFISCIAMIAYLYFFQHTISYTKIVIHLALMQSWIPSFPLSMNGPSWFLSTLFAFYLSLPFILKTLKSYDNNTLNLFVALSIWCLTQILLTYLLSSSFYKGFPSASHDLIYYSPLSHFCSFLLGVVGGSIKVKFHKNLTINNYMAYILFATSIIIIISLINNQAKINKLMELNFPFSASFYAPLFLMATFTINSTSSFEINKKLSKFMLWLGAISFPMYILQTPIMRYVDYFTYSQKPSKPVEFIFYISSLIMISTFTLKLLQTLSHAYSNIKNKYTTNRIL